MSNSQGSGKLIGVGIISAIAASLCCITPILAVIAGSSGFASSFTWLEPARPYFIGASVLVLGFAWYQKFKKQKQEMTCDCEAEKPSFWQSKFFLAIVTFFSVAMILFPYYSKAFFPLKDKQIVNTANGNFVQDTLEIEGMGCKACENEINSAALDQDGVANAFTSYENNISIIRFDSTKISLEEIAALIREKTGYKASVKK